MKCIIYHQVKQGVDCPDGIMAAAIAQLANPEFEIVGDWYNSNGEWVTEPIGKSDEFIIVDFSYPAATLLLWEELGVKITLIDHHAPKFPELEGFSGAILDANECGATLAWKHFFPDEPMPEILKHVRRRDIGADDYYKAPEKCLDSKRITAALSKGRATYSGNKVAYLQSWLTADAASIRGLELLGETLQAQDADRAAELAAIAYPSKLPAPCDGIACWKVVIQDEKDNRLVSQIGAAVCQENGEGTIAWIVASTGENSLRSHGVDISGYAKSLGGGGHKFAAGFKKQEAIAK